MKTVCCEKAIISHAVYWDTSNKVIQCHVCGHVYTPTSKVKYFLNRLFKWW